MFRFYCAAHFYNLFHEWVNQMATYFSLAYDFGQKGVCNVLGLFPTSSRE